MGHANIVGMRTNDYYTTGKDMEAPEQSESQEHRWPVRNIIIACGCLAIYAISLIEACIQFASPPTPDRIDAQILCLLVMLVSAAGYAIVTVIQTPDKEDA